jgi:hypothetical protein
VYRFRLSNTMAVMKILGEIDHVSIAHSHMTTLLTS